MRAQRDDAAYWLEGKMHESSYEAIENCLWAIPPSNQELVVLALEEARRPECIGGARSEVYRLFEQYKRK